ncbi:MAG: nuclear transport factor 2 family protein, partial [Acidobacteria bacterium]|nr:nuclear transport factor 2 family protein [Acidobacteriota bacterium]
ELIEPVVIQTVYSKFGDVARWDIFGGAQNNGQVARQNNQKTLPSASRPIARSARTEIGEANTLRAALDRWIDATNAHNIEKQMAFYMPELKSFYLVRNASRSSIRAEKTRIFAGAKSIDIRAAEPEIIFQDGGRTAVMRFRKKYNLTSGSKNRRGEVIQELRWQRTSGGWKIFSERDIRVIS